MNGRTTFELELGYRESLLLILDEEGKFEADYKKEKRYIEAEFTLDSDDKELFVKTYKATVNVGEKDNLWIKVKADEMAECFVNGSFAGVSFWNEHEFEISDFVKEGNNEIILKVTGNASNRFTENTIEYGLKI